MNKHFITLFILLLIGNLDVIAQTSRDFDEDIFISHLKLENIIQIRDVNTREYLRGYKHLDSIKIDIEPIVELPISPNLIIYKFQLGKNKIDINSTNKEIIFNSSSCNTFIIAINSQDNTSFRLKGFSGNDLLFLLREINESSYKKRKLSKILKELQGMTDELNFKCIYKSLVKRHLYSTCLKPCKEGKLSHLSY